MATRGLPETFEDTIRQGFEPGPNNPHWRLVRGEPFVHVHDLATVEDAPERSAVATMGIGTLLAVAFRKDDVLVGRIVAARQEVRPFAEKEIALLQNFAAQSVIAMENARLLTETRDALEQQTATAEVLQVINSSPGDLAPVFDAMLEKALRLCDAAYGHLWTFDGERIAPLVSRGEPQFAEWVRSRGPLRPSAGTPIGRIVGGEGIIHVRDALNENAYPSAPHFQEQIRINGIRTILFVPLRKETALLGVIVVYRREVRPFAEKEIALLQNFAAQAVIAMENARLLTETHEALEQQTATAEVLGVINSSPGDLVPVFDTILDKAHALCDIALGELELYEDGKVRAVATRGFRSVRKPFTPTVRTATGITTGQADCR